MWFLVTVLTFLAIGSHASADDQSLEIPSFLKICHRSDPNLDECVMNSIEALRPYLKNGIPEFDLPPYDPVTIADMPIDQATGSISIKWRYSNITVHGAIDFVLKRVRMEPDGSRIRLRINFPLLKLSSVYDIDGKILLLPIVAKGTSQANVSDIHAVASISFEKYQNDKTGKTHLRMSDYYIDFTVGHFATVLHDLSHKDSVLMNAINLLLNENWQVFAAEMKPVFEKIAGGMIENIVNKIFGKYPLDVLLPP